MTTPLVYVERSPAPPLRRHVRCLWLLETPPSAPPPPADRVLPDGCVEIVLHYGAAFERRAETDAVSVTQHRHAVVGQIETALELRPAGPVGILGIRFEPAGARPLLGVALHELTGRSVALEDVWGRGAARLLDVVHGAPSPSARLGAAERVLQAMALRADAPRTAAEEAVAAIAASHGGAPLSDVLAALGGGGRTLERRFRDDVGIAPKTLARVVRFQRSVKLLRASPAPSLVSVAAACGYADQAHFTREFAQFAGEPPGRWLRGEHDLAGAFVES